MIELIILIIPGAVAALLHCKLNNCMNWKKILLCFIPYTLCINLLILGGLWLIGMRRFSLSAMSLGFKFKWFMLGVILAVILCITFVNICNMKYKTFKNMMQRLLPTSILFTVTYAVYSPSSLFLENIDEFMLNYINILPIILCAALTFLILINAAALCITNENNVIYYIALVFALSLGTYIQRNFLNPQFPDLDGAQIDWGAYATENTISSCFWVVCILAMLAVAYFYKKKSEQIIKYASWFLSAVQMVSLVVLIITTSLSSNINYGFSKEGEFTVGSGKNIIIFIVDCLQSSAMEEYITSDFYKEGQLDDFTFFDNAVAGGAPTQLGLPVFLTGSEYDPMQPIDEFREEAWEDTPLYDSLHKNGYDVRFYTTLGSIITIGDNVADNYEITTNLWITDYPQFTIQLYKLVNFYVMPQFIKSKFWLSTETLLDNIDSTSDNYRLNDPLFYQDMLSSIPLDTAYDNSFRLYHLRGAHSPYITNENLETVEENSVTEQQQLQGVMQAIYLYIDEMKAAGIYDNSTIIIAGDHGRHEKLNLETNPAVLIKMPNASHTLEHNSNPIHHRNITATMASVIMDDYSAYGPSVYDITADSDVERLHTINRGIRDRNNLDDTWDNSYGCCRFIVPYDTDSLDEYKIWDPYNINRITYTLGENIDFTSGNNIYDEQISYRLYKENSGATASNELSICFELTDYQKGDLTFHFTYSKVYNNTQNIKLYANGSKVGEITCTSENAGGDNKITIPKSKIDGNELIIRMVFPNAVTPNQLDRSNPDTRVLSVEFNSMRLE